MGCPEYNSLDLGSVVQQLQALVAGRDEALVSLAAAQEAAASERAVPEAEGVAGLEVERLRLAGEEAMQRVSIGQAGPEELAHLQQQLSEGLWALGVMRACSMEVEQQETLARMALAEEQLSFAMGLAAGLPGVVGRLAEAQSAAQGSQQRVEALEEALEERELALGQVARELEALRDAQVASGVEAQQRQLGRSEGERRAALVGEQKAAWGTLQEIERGSRQAAFQHAMERLVLAETLGRLSIAEELITQGGP